ncbi:MAG: enoyl-CoA hydratase [Chloroflexi bacterium]|nr:MAG: enoyl-CoA hydratase [Chloroflexota bacterium]
MSYELIELRYEGDFATITMNSPKRRNALSSVCTTLMETIQAIPQPVLARVHAIATAAGCQLVATCDLAVASTEAVFATPGGKGGWFCTTPMVAVSRNIGRKRALEMLLTGDTIHAHTAADWGLINRVVSPDQLVEESQRLLEAATRGSFISKGMGKQAYYTQIDLPQHQAYAYAMEVMAAASQVPDAQEGMHAFLEKRKANFKQPS